MSLNTAHINGGVLIHSGECILLFADNVTVEWSGQGDGAFKGSKHGRFYLTTHRLIFNNKNTNDPMISFSFPFVTLSEVEIEQPVFGANYIKGKVRAQPNGNWIGEAKFKLTFKRGGAIDFGQAMLKAAYLGELWLNIFLYQTSAVILLNNEPSSKQLKLKTIGRNSPPNDCICLCQTQ
jgi:hypothetical protein